MMHSAHAEVAVHTLVRRVFDTEGIAQLYLRPAEWQQTPADDIVLNLSERAIGGQLSELPGAQRRTLHQQLRGAAARRSFRARKVLHQPRPRFLTLTGADAFAECFDR